MDCFIGEARQLVFNHNYISLGLCPGVKRNEEYPSTSSGVPALSFHGDDPMRSNSLRVSYEWHQQH